MKMTKIVATAAAVLFASSVVFAEGLSVSGYLRAGAAADIDAESFDATAANDGYNYGLGGSRLRVNVAYENENGGVTFRFQKTGDFTTDFFDTVWSDKNDDDAVDANELGTGSNVKWAMGYANFLNGKLVTEAGYLTDRFTTTGGDWDSGLDGCLGVRAVVFPIEGLTLAAQVSNVHSDTYVASDKKVLDGDAAAGDTKADEKLLSFNAKYETKDFFVTAGYHLSEYAYGSLGITAVENLSAVFEVAYDNTDDCLNDTGSDPVIMYCGTFGYNVDALSLALVAYYYTDTDASDPGATGADSCYTIYPGVSYAINDKVSASLDLGIIGSDVDGDDGDVLVTPAVTFNASDSAKTQVYYTYSKENHSSIGVTVKKSF